jgi:hypothetical protein
MNRTLSTMIPPTASLCITPFLTQAQGTPVTTAPPTSSAERARAAHLSCLRCRSVDGSLRAVLSLALLVMAVPLQTAAHEDTGVPAKLGQVEFNVECNAAAQKQFNLAMAYYHSFAWSQMTGPIEAVLKADPSCGMAHWVRALGSMNNPFGWPGTVSTKVLNDGLATLDAARAAGLKSQRERDYVDALAVFFTDHDKLNHRTRAKALEVALEQHAKKYPDDREASIIYALILSANFDPTDKKYTNQLKAAALLEPLFKEQPEHPGVAHYLIHSYDYPPIARQGLDAAMRYAKIAADAPHAQHMPSHIFTRVGAWRESIEANIASARADKERGWNTMHAYDYMAYAHLQLAQDVAALKVLRDAQAVTYERDNFASAYATAAIPARLALERGRWADAAALELGAGSAAPTPWAKYPQAEAINAFARGIGAANIKDGAKTQVEIQRLKQLRDAAAALKLNYWVEQIEIQADVVGGLALVAEGKGAEGVDALRKAADREDATEKSVVTPGSIVPAREVLARVLLDAGRHADALREFEAVMKKEPNRLRATADAALAAERSGDAARARDLNARVLELAAAADTPLLEVAQAKRFLGRR